MLSPGSKELRTLDFDIENRPLSYLGMDFTTADVTAIAAGWVGEEDVWVGLQTKSQSSLPRLLKKFRSMWEEADVVTGHYILKHDIGHIQGALIEFDLPLLGPKLVSDTKIHLKKFTGLSKSQENLGHMFELTAPKYHMNTPMWREANRLSKEGMELTKARVVEDVVMHKEMRAKLIKLGLLNPPTLWRP